jgi:hypothetical protein
MTSPGRGNTGDADPFHTRLLITMVAGWRSGSGFFRTRKNRPIPTAGLQARRIVIGRAFHLKPFLKHALITEVTFGWISLAFTWNIK